MVERTPCHVTDKRLLAGWAEVFKSSWDGVGEAHREGEVGSVDRVREGGREGGKRGGGVAGHQDSPLLLHLATAYNSSWSPSPSESSGSPSSCKGDYRGNINIILKKIITVGKT